MAKNNQSARILFVFTMMTFNLESLKTTLDINKVQEDVANLVCKEGETSIERVHCLLIQLLRDTVVLNTFPHTTIPLIVSFCFELLRKNSDQIEDLAESFSSFIVDTTWFIDNELESLKESDDSLSTVSPQRSLLAGIVRQLIHKEVVSKVHLMERLELEFLELLGLIESQVLLSRKIVRTNTSNLYRQQKFNLIREESEGYSKLITELSSNLPLLSDTYIIPTPNHNYDDTVVLQVLENIQALIGYFDLDPNRVLDIIFDVFTTNIVDHWRFFITLLLNSPWKPRSPTESKLDENGECVGREIILKPRSICGQLIGFKFSYYREATTKISTPKNLYLATALLIKNHLVDLEDVFPHLGPSDEELDRESELYNEELTEKVKTSGRFSSSGLTGSLTDDSVSTSEEKKQKEEKAEVVVVESPLMTLRKANQKAGLLLALLSTGQLDAGRKILEVFPVFSKIYPDISEAMSRILQVIIEPVYKPISPSNKLRIPNVSSQTMKKLREPFKTTEFRSTTISNLIQVGKRTHAPFYQYFYESWKDNIIPCNNMDQMLKITRELLPYIGIHLYLDLKLATKLMRLGAHQLEKSIDDEKVRSSWIVIISQYLFPAISQLDHNPAIANELYALVQKFPYETRFALYGEWKHKTYNLIPELKIAKASCTKDTRYIMRRLSKENVKQYGRYIGKTVHSNPTIAFTIIIDQLQSYDNQIPHVVDASRYLTDLEFDVLNFCMLEALSNSTKERIQPCGTLVSKWLVALSQFCGTLWRKHAIELKGLLHYVTNQLLGGNICDLIVLQELISQMAGIKLLDEATTDQLDAFAGGESLRRDALMLENLRLIKKPSARLTRALIDTKLAVKLGFLMAQSRRDIAFTDKGTKDLKITGWMFDHCHKTLVQYFDFLIANVDRDSYPNLFTDIKELCVNFGIEPEVAFHILRPKFFWLLKNEVYTAPAAEVSVMDVDNEKEIWSPSLLSTIKAMDTILPVSVTSKMTSAFYVTFWQLSLYDIYIPKQRYLTEIKKYQLASTKLDDQLRYEQNTAMILKTKKEKERLVQCAEQLQKELLNQEENYKRVSKRLTIEKQHWFEDGINGNDICNLVMQYCIYPRALFTAQDAVFSARFVMHLHSIGTRNWASLLCFDKILSRETIHSVIFSCSENEARNYGVFLADILKNLGLWRKDQKIYEKDCISNDLPGFVKRSIPASPDSPKLYFTWEEYRRIMYKWHGKLRRAFSSCLESKEYMQTRNAIIVLDKIRESFPIIRSFGESIEKLAKHIETTEERGDLKQLARSYHAKLQSYKVNWMSLTRFSPLSAADAMATATKESRTRISLNVAAKPFVPNGATSVSLSSNGENTPMILDSPSTVSKEIISVQSSPSQNQNSLLNADIQFELIKELEKRNVTNMHYSKATTSMHSIALTSDLEAKRDLVKSTLENKVDRERKLLQSKKDEEKKPIDSRKGDSIIGRDNANKTQEEKRPFESRKSDTFRDYGRKDARRNDYHYEARNRSDNGNVKDRERLTSNLSTHESPSKINDRKSFYGGNEDGEVREEPSSKPSQLPVKKDEYKQSRAANSYYGGSRDRDASSRRESDERHRDDDRHRDGRKRHVEDSRSYDSYRSGDKDREDPKRLRTGKDDRDRGSRDTSRNNDRRNQNSRR